MTAPFCGRYSYASRKEQGSITVFFCLFAFILIGALSYSLYIGQVVKRKVQVRNASDSAVLAIASHSATGLNMISANNISIAGAIHVTGSLAIASVYGSVARAALYSGSDTRSDIGAGFNGIGNALGDEVNANLAALYGLIDQEPTHDEIVANRQSNLTNPQGPEGFNPRNSSQVQEDIWDNVGKAAEIFMQAASGLTRLNGFVADRWMYLGQVRGVELARYNAPGSISYHVQHGSASPIIKYGPILKQTRPKQTICHSLPDEDDLQKFGAISSWLKGPFLALTDYHEPGEVGSMASIFTDLTEFMDNIMDVMPIALVDCGYGYKIPILSFVSQFVSGLTTGQTVEQAVGTLNAIPAIYDAKDELIIPKGEFEKKCTGLSYLICMGHLEICYPLYKLGFTWDVAEEAFDSTVEKDNYQRALEVIALKKIREQGGSPICTADVIGVPQEGDYQTSTGKWVRNIPNAIPRTDDSGLTSCIPILNVAPVCPVAHAFRGGEIHKAICNKFDFKGKQDTKIKEVCHGYKQLKDSTGGINIVDWGEQSDTISNLDARARDDLGFLIIDQTIFTPNDFRYESIVGLPVWTTDEFAMDRCPEAFRYEQNGETLCREQPLIGFGPNDQGNSANTASPSFANVDLLDGGRRKVLSTGSLDSIWSRLQLSYSEAEVIHDPRHGDPQPASVGLQTFWPAWRPKLRIEDGLAEVLERLKSLGNGANPSSNSPASSTYSPTGSRSSGTAVGRTLDLLQ